MKNNIKTLNIEKAESLIGLEQKINKLFTSEEYKLRLPSKLNTRGALGVEVAIIQLIGTWLSESERKIFHSYQEGVSDFSGLCSSIYGLSALTMSGEIWNKEKTPLRRGVILNDAKKTIENIRTKNYGGSFTSRYFGIPCIKKSTYDREFNMPVYNGGEVIDSGSFLIMLKSILENTINGKSRFKRLDDYIGVEGLSDLMWELFKNTHDHGRTDVDGNELLENFRSLIIQQQDVTQDYLKLWLGENPSDAQKDFNSSLNDKVGNQSILDISVVDYGKGFIEMAKHKSEAIDESEVLMHCLEKGWSRLRKTNRGYGLTKVLAKVNKYKGWLRIRTGNYLIEKAYISNDALYITKEDIKKMDCNVVGTSFHISIPLNN